MAGLPLADPQFWIVTAATLLVVGLALRRVRRAARTPELPCARCPQARAHGRRAAGGPLRLLLAAALALAAPAEAVRTERRWLAMGTTLTVAVEAPTRAEGLALSERVFAAVRATEARLSTWRHDSELSRLNAAPPGATVALSAATVAELGAALECAAESGGAFDPTLAPLVAAWDLRGAGRRPSAAELEAARRAGGAAARLAPLAAVPAVAKLGAVAIEEGGFGKGAALAAALAVAAAAGGELDLDFGGQLAWTGRRRPLALALADPRARDRAALELTVETAAGSASTSGNGERGREIDGVRIGHLLDPASGEPAPDFGSVTYLDADPLRADCRSTALFVLGPERGAAWAAAHGWGDWVFLVTGAEGLVARASPGLAGRLRPLVPDLAVVIARDAP